MKKNENTLNSVYINPILSYENADIQKMEILKANQEKTGIYRWTHKESGKSYIGSAINLSRRFRSYYSIGYLLKEISNNNSMIYKALIKYGYLSFKLDILEYCDASILIKREQYYLDNLNPMYNILKSAGSLLDKGFKHNKATIEVICASKLGHNHREETKLKIAVGNVKALPVLVINIKGEVIEFISIRKASKHIGKHYSYITKCLKRHGFYKGKLFIIKTK